MQEQVDTLNKDAQVAAETDKQLRLALDELSATKDRLTDVLGQVAEKSSKVTQAEKKLAEAQKKLQVAC